MGILSLIATALIVCQVGPHPQQEYIDFLNAKKLTLAKRVPDNLPMPSQATSMDTDAMQKGSIGRLDYWNFVVADVVDSKNIILRLGFDRRYWLEEFPTDGLADGMEVRIIDLSVCTGTKQYVNVAGGKSTIKSIKLLTPDEAKKINDDLQKEANEKLFREFTSVTGSKVKARFDRYVGGKVQLTTDEGRVIYVALGDFAKEDGDYLRELIRKIKATR